MIRMRNLWSRKMLQYLMKTSVLMGARLGGQIGLHFVWHWIQSPVQLLLELNRHPKLPVLTWKRMTCLHFCIVQNLQF